MTEETSLNLSPNQQSFIKHFIESYREHMRYSDQNGMMHSSTAVLLYLETLLYSEDEIGKANKKTWDSK